MIREHKVCVCISLRVVSPHAPSKRNLMRRASLEEETTLVVPRAGSPPAGIQRRQSSNRAILLSDQITSEANAKHLTSATDCQWCTDNKPIHPTCC